MAIRVQTEFIRKATVRIIAYVYDDDGDLVDPTSVGVTIKKGSSIEQNDTAMSNAVMGTGIYEYYYTTSTSVSTGVYQIEIHVTDGSYHTYAHATFSMEAGINE